MLKKNNNDNIEKLYLNVTFIKNTIFKENKNKSGIYRWTNKKNGKSYIGSSINIGNRFYSYFTENFLKKANTKISNALNKHKHDKFSFEILEYCPKENLIEREQYYLDNYNHEYNILTIAGSTYGYKHTDQARKKMSESRKGRFVSPETRFKISLGNKGKFVSAETRLKISLGNKGKFVSAETRLKMSLKRKGKFASAETRLKMSLSKKNKKRLVLSMLGKNHSVDSKLKISENLKKYYNLMNSDGKKKFVINKQRRRYNLTENQIWTLVVKEIITDKENIFYSYASAAKYYNIKYKTIQKWTNTQKIYKKKYIFNIKIENY